jgi:ketosteroid isomerase-like protein
MRSLKSTALSPGLLFVALLLASCQAAPTPSPTPTAAPDLVAPVEAWVDAINKGDVNAALELLADNALWSAQYTSYEGGGARDSGKEQVRPQFDYLVGLGMKSQLKDCQPQDDRVVCGLSVVYGCIAPFGAPDGLAAKLVFIYQPDGKVREISFSLLDDPRFEDYSRFLTASDAWAIENRAEEHAKLKPRGTGLGGSLEAKFCKEYAASLKAAPPTPAADLVAPVKAWADALNNGDVDAALSLFTDNVRWDIWGAPANGKEASRTLLDWLVASEFEQQITNCQPQADRVACNLSYVDGCSAASGTPDGLPAKLVFIYQPDGKITQAILARGGEPPDDVTEFWNGWRTWTRVNRAADWAKVAEKNGEGGALTVKTCKEYAASLK